MITLGFAILIIALVFGVQFKVKKPQEDFVSCITDGCVDFIATFKEFVALLKNKKTEKKVKTESEVTDSAEEAGAKVDVEEEKSSPMKKEVPEE